MVQNQCCTVCCIYYNFFLDGKVQWEEEAHVDRDKSDEVN